MSVLEWLFSFHGRINAAQFRQGGALAGFIAGMLFAASGAAINNAGPAFEPRTKVLTLCVIWGALIVLLIWSNAALQAKRLHDRGRSGFLALISVFLFLIWAGLVGYLGVASMEPAEGELESVANIQQILEQDAQLLLALGGVSTLVSLWVFIDLGLMPGTPGSNQFGPEPGQPNTQPQAPGGGPSSAPRKSWFTPKPAANSWDVSGAEAALAKAIAERNSNGATTTGEAWKEGRGAGFSKASSRNTFGRRN